MIAGGAVVAKSVSRCEIENEGSSVISVPTQTLTS